MLPNIKTPCHHLFHKHLILCPSHLFVNLILWTLQKLIRRWFKLIFIWRHWSIWCMFWVNVHRFVWHGIKVVCCHVRTIRRCKFVQDINVFNVVWVLIRWCILIVLILSVWLLICVWYVRCCQWTCCLMNWLNMKSSVRLTWFCCSTARD